MQVLKGYNRHQMFIIFLILLSVASFTAPLKDFVLSKIPTEDIDFLIGNQSSLNGKFPIRDYKILKLGNHLYLLKVFIVTNTQRVKTKHWGPLKVEIIKEKKAPAGEIDLKFWYRRGRVLIFETTTGIKFYDLAPKCILKMENREIVPVYSEKYIEVKTKVGNLNLQLIFTKCNL
jgi:hypothetical protein